MDADRERDLRATIIGLRVMLDKAVEGLLYIENENENRDDCVRAATEALEDIGERP